MERVTKDDYIDTMEIYKKLTVLEDIEEELGIDLVTLFKAQTNPIYFLKFNGHDENGEPTYVIAKEKHPLYVDFDVKALVGYFIQYDFKHYGKRWALTKDELERQGYAYVDEDKINRDSEKTRYPSEIKEKLE